MTMAFEISEYLFYIGVVLAAALLSQASEPLVMVFGLALFIVGTYALVLRQQADYETARLVRILGSLALIMTSALSGATPLAMLSVLWGMGVLIITTSEHISHRGYIPVEKA